MATTSNVQNALKLYGTAKTNGLNTNVPNTYLNSVWYSKPKSYSCPADATATNAAVKSATRASNVACVVSIIGAVASLIQPATDLCKFITGNKTSKGTSGSGNNETSNNIDQSVSALDSAMKQADKTSDYDSLQTAVKQAWTDYNTNQAAIDKADGELQAAKGQVDTMNKTTIPDDDKAVADEKSKKETAENNFKTAEAGVKSAQEELDKANAIDGSKDPDKATKVQAAQKKLEDAKTKQKEAQDAIDKAKNALQTAQEKLKTHKDDLTKLQQNVEDKTKAKAELVKKNEALKGKIDKANTTLDKRGKKVENSEAKQTTSSSKETSASQTESKQTKSETAETKSSIVKGSEKASEMIDNEFQCNVGEFNQKLNNKNATEDEMNNLSNDVDKFIKENPNLSASQKSQLNDLQKEALDKAEEIKKSKASAKPDQTSQTSEQDKSLTELENVLNGIKPQSKSGQKEYTVQSGDKLGDIAHAFHTNVNHLLDLNQNIKIRKLPSTNPNYKRPGDYLLPGDKIKLQ